MALFARFSDKSGLTLAGLLAWGAGAVFGAAHSPGVAASFITAGTALFMTRAFYNRAQGLTTVGAQGLTTNLTPAIGVQGPAGEARSPLPPDLDASTLVARWPTLAAAFEAIPLDWTKERVHHDDGQEYVHIRSPQAGYELVVNVAALDSAAPQWLMVAIAVMAGN